MGLVLDRIEQMFCPSFCACELQAAKSQNFHTMDLSDSDSSIDSPGGKRCGRVPVSNALVSHPRPLGAACFSNASWSEGQVLPGNPGKVSPARVFELEGFREFQSSNDFS